MDETLTPEEIPEVIPEMIPDTIPEEPVPQAVTVVDVQFRPGQKVYFFDPDGAAYAAGDHVIMDTARGEEFGTITAGNHGVRPQDVVAPLRKILRRATERDERINEENRAKEKRAFEICCQKAALHELDMQTVSAECAFDGSKILFYFTADERVDFRELVKDLASVFHTRIELRQIGVRDKARMVGGLGICGRPFCCASFLDDFQPVSIKMAKTQNLSLNPTKISGTCGRLMCCLKYEQDTYEDLIRSSPKVDSFVDTPEGRGTIIDSEILRQRVKVRMENNPDTVNVFSNDEIAVLRSGRAKKNDPPIPADLAPISGSGARPRKTAEAVEASMLEPIRFRYSTEKIVEEPEAAAEQPEAVSSEAAPAAEQPKAPRENRRRREDRPRRPAADPSAAPKAADQPEPEKQEGQQPRRNNRPPKKPRPEQPRQEAKQDPDARQQPPAENAEAAQQPRKENRSRSHRPRRPRAEGSQAQPQAGAEKQEPVQPKPPKAPKPADQGQPGKASGEPSASQEGSRQGGGRRRHRPRGPRNNGPKPQE